jgi:hypothetical protein
VGTDRMHLWIEKQTDEDKSHQQLLETETEKEKEICLLLGVEANEVVPKAGGFHPQLNNGMDVKEIGTDLFLL